MTLATLVATATEIKLDRLIAGDELKPLSATVAPIHRLINKLSNERALARYEHSKGVKGDKGDSIKGDSIKGDDGDSIKGDDGDSITDVSVKGGRLFVELNGVSRDLGRVVGRNGKDAAPAVDGRGISSTDINDDGDLVITYTDGRSQNVGRVVGEDGEAPAHQIERNPLTGVARFRFRKPSGRWGKWVDVVTRPRIFDGGGGGGAGKSNGGGGISSVATDNTIEGNGEIIDPLLSYGLMNSLIVHPVVIKNNQVMINNEITIDSENGGSLDIEAGGGLILLQTVA